MPITVRQLVDDPALGLTVLTQAGPLDTPVLWAHTSELADPAQWLEGGELLMTLGLGLPTDPRGVDAYVRRLVRAGVVAVAVDTGIVLDDVPGSVVAAGERHGLTVLRIPPATPFLAISRAVLNALTADAVSAIKHVAVQQERVATAALRAGVEGVVESLASTLSADVVLLDSRGDVIDQAGSQTQALRLRAIRRLGPNLRRAGSLVHVYADQVLTVQSFVGEGGDPTFLVLGATESFSAHQRLVVSHAVTLLALLARTPARLASVEEHLRTSAARLLLAEGGGCDPTLAKALGFDPDGSVVVAHVLAATPAAASALADRLVADVGGSMLRSELPDGHVVAAPEITLTPAMELETHRRGWIGVSAYVPFSQLDTALRQAASAARLARLQGRPTVSYADLAPTDSLLLSLPTESVKALVEAVLRPLRVYDEHSGSTLVATLESFLANNGQIDAAAKSLQIHRHTLSQRLQRVQSVLGRDLSSAVVRADLWLALRATSILQSAEAPLTEPTAVPPPSAGRVR